MRQIKRIISTAPALKYSPAQHGRGHGHTSEGLAFFFSLSFLVIGAFAHINSFVLGGARPPPPRSHQGLPNKAVRKFSLEAALGLNHGSQELHVLECTSARGRGRGTGLTQVRWLAHTPNRALTASSEWGFLERLWMRGDGNCVFHVF